MEQENVWDLWSLKGRRALVTGGARNLGLDIAYGLAEAGADVAITSRDLEQARESAKTIATATSAKVVGLSCNVRYEDSVRAAVHKTIEALDGLNLLVNNAGNVESDRETGPLENRPLQEWNRTIEVNLQGVFLCCKHAVALAMKPSLDGVIINIGSVVGMVGKDRRCYQGTNRFGPTVDYAAAKGGVINMTRDLAVYLAPFGIRVNCISPGGFDTGLETRFVRQYGEDVPLGRMGTMGKEIKGAAVFLASEAASYITGANLPVDGGLTAW